MKFNLHPELDTPRLKLRHMLVSDFKRLSEIRHNEKVLEYIQRVEFKDENEVKKFIEQRLEDTKKGKLCYWGISNKEEENLMGTICLWNFNHKHNIAEIGYELHPDFQGYGYMSEAVKAVCIFGFERLKLKRIEAFTHKANGSSKKLLEKFGFKLARERIDDGFPNNLIYIRTNA